MPSLHLDPSTGTVTLANGRLELTIETLPWYNPCRLRDLQSGRALADSDYVWADGAPAALAEPPVLTTLPDGTGRAVFKLKKGGLALEQTFNLPGDEPNVIVEAIQLVNPGPHIVDTSLFGCGFGKLVQRGSEWLADAAATRLCEVPYRHHPESGVLRDFALPELLQTESWYSPVRSPRYRKRQSTAYGSEGWAWYGTDTVLLVSKYNPDAMEW